MTPGPPRLRPQFATEQLARIPHLARTCPFDCHPERTCPFDCHPERSCPFDCHSERSEASPHFVRSPTMPRPLPAKLFLLTAALIAITLPIAFARATAQSTVETNRAPAAGQTQY